MSRGLGVRQREILEGLRRVHCADYPVLWHNLLSTEHPLGPNWFGHSGLGRGRPLGLYRSDSARSVQVAYRRAAASLEERDLLELRPGGGLGYLLYVRLPVTPAQRIAAAGLTHRYAEYQRRLDSLGMEFARISHIGGSTQSLVDLRRQMDPLRKWMSWFETIDADPGLPRGRDAFWV